MYSCIVVQLSTADTFPAYASADGLADLAKYASGFGPDKTSFVNSHTNYTQARQLVDTFHAHNVFLHPYTFRADQDIEAVFLGDFEVEEMFFYCCLGMDALFSEFPDRSRETIDIYTKYITAEQKCSIQCDLY